MSPHILTSESAPLRSRSSLPKMGRALINVLLGFTLGIGAVSAAPEPAPKKLSPAPISSFKSTLQLKSDSATWDTSGFRVQLNFCGGDLLEGAPAPPSALLGVEFLIGARLDADWSMMTSLRYASASGGISGLSFSGLLEPTYHLWRGLTLSVGVGVAGVVESAEVRTDRNPEQTSIIVSSYTFPADAPLISSCTGFGGVTAARLGYWFTLSEITAIGVSARLDYQRIACEQSTDRVEPDTAEGIMRRQWWSQLGWSVSGGLSWR